MQYLEGYVHDHPVRHPIEPIPLRHKDGKLSCSGNFTGTLEHNNLASEIGVVIVGTSRTSFITSSSTTNSYMFLFSQVIFAAVMAIAAAKPGNLLAAPFAAAYTAPFAAAYTAPVAAAYTAPFAAAYTSPFAATYSAPLRYAAYTSPVAAAYTAPIAAAYTSPLAAYRAPVFLK